MRREQIIQVPGYPSIHIFTEEPEKPNQKPGLPKLDETEVVPAAPVEQPAAPAPEPKEAKNAPVPTLAPDSAKTTPKETKAAETTAKAAQPAAPTPEPKEAKNAPVPTLAPDSAAQPEVKAAQPAVTAGEDTPTKEATWFQKGAFADGYQFGDVTKTIAATGRDLKENILTGAVGLGEKTVDALLWAAPYIAQGQYYQNGGGYNLEADRAFQAQNDAAKAWSEEMIQKDLYDEEKVAEALMLSDTFEKVTGIDTERDSVSGEKLDGLARSGGEIAGTAALTLAGVPAAATVFASSFGGEAENALKEGASMEEAGMSAAITAGAEVLTDKFSDAINLIGGKTVTGAIQKQLAQVISDKTARTLLNLGVEVTGEGFEEVLTEVIGKLGQKLTYLDEQSLQELITKESLWDAFIGGIVMGSAGKAAKVGWDGRAVATEATGSKVTVGNKTYELIGYDANGSKVYQDAEVLREQAAKEKTVADQDATTQPENGQESVENSENRDKMKLGIQFFAKKSQDYSTVILERAEYAHVMSEIATNLTKEQAQMRTFSRAIGEYIYFVENNGFGEYRIFKKIKILEDE